MISRQVIEKAADMVRRGFTASVIMAECGISLGTVSAIRRREGVKRYYNQASKQTEQNVRECIRQGMGDRVAARVCGCSASVVERLRANKPPYKRWLSEVRPGVYKRAVAMLKKRVPQCVIAEKTGLDDSVVSRIRVIEKIPSRYKGKDSNEAVLPTSQVRPSGQQDKAVRVQRS